MKNYTANIAIQKKEFQDLQVEVVSRLEKIKILDKEMATARLLVENENKKIQKKQEALSALETTISDRETLFHSEINVMNSNILTKESRIEMLDFEIDALKDTVRDLDKDAIQKKDHPLLKYFKEEISKLTSVEAQKRASVVLLSKEEAALSKKLKAGQSTLQKLARQVRTLILDINALSPEIDALKVEKSQAVLSIREIQKRDRDSRILNKRMTKEYEAKYSKYFKSKNKIE